MAWPAKSTSHQRRASNSPRRRPVKAAVRKTVASWDDAAARTSAWISSGEYASMSVEIRTRGRSTSATGLRGSPHTPHSAPEDAVQHDQTFLHVAVGAGDSCLPALEQLRRHVFEPDRAEVALDQ